MKVLAYLSVLVAIAPTAVADTVLLDFSAKWCPPCRQMEPVVAGLEREGYQVQRLNVDVPENKARAQQYQVKEIPTFIVLKDGRESGRLVGAVPAENLRRLLGPATQGRVSAKPASEIPQKLAERPVAPSPRADKRVGLDLVRYSVRIVVDDARSRSFGTGTVIQSVPGETIILTCGHLFEGVSGQARTTVEFFGVRERAKAVAELVARDREADLSLIRVASSVTVPAAPVAPNDFLPRTGLPAASVGCDNGSDPTTRQMVITAVNRYVGAPTIECSGEPVEGRSGGGLFNEQGEIIGVCSARDPAEHRGIYGGTAAIHKLLNRNRLASLCQPRADKEASVRLASMDQDKRGQRLTLPPAHELGLQVDRNLPLPDGAESAEVVCVIRSLQDPNLPAKVVLLNRASPEFLSILDKEQTQQSPRSSTSMVMNSPAGPASKPLDKSAPAATESDSVDRAGWRGVTKPKRTDPPSVEPVASEPVQESAKWQKDWPPGATSSQGPLRR